MQGCVCSPGFAQRASFLFLGDTLKVLPQLADESVDCIVTDPPYGINYKSLSRSLPKTTIVNDGPEAFELLDQSMALACSKLKVNSHIYIFTNRLAYAPMAAVVTKYFTFKNVLIWVKNNVTRGDLKGNYGYRDEWIIYAHKGRRHLNGRRSDNIVYFNRVYSRAMRHPVEKPVSLLEYLILKSTNAGETVLDMFAGAGSTLVAAKNLDRNYIGIELDEVWYRVARERLGV